MFAIHNGQSLLLFAGALTESLKRPGQAELESALAQGRPLSSITRFPDVIFWDIDCKSVAVTPIPIQVFVR